MDAIRLLLCYCHPIQIILTIILALPKTFQLITPLTSEDGQRNVQCVLKRYILMTLGS